MLTKIEYVTTEKGNQGIQLYFDAAPTGSVLEKLHKLKFRWHSTNKYWYQRVSDETRAFAERLKSGMPVETQTDKEGITDNYQHHISYKSQFTYTTNGVKDENGKYFSCSYDFNKINLTITLFYDTYGDAPCPTGAKFENNSDSMTDYFEQSLVRLPVTCPDYIAALDGYKKQTAFRNRNREKRAQKRGQTIPKTYEEKYKFYRSQYASLHINDEKGLEEMARSFAQRDIDEEKALSEALNLAQQLAKKVLTGDIEEVKTIVANRENAEKQRQEKAYLEMNKAQAQAWLEKGALDGKIEKIGSWCVNTIKSTIQVYDGTRLFNPSIEYNLIVINLDTGKRHEQSGRYDSLEEIECIKFELALSEKSKC